jgi:DNA-binding MarR family transcriptional regulator
MKLNPRDIAAPSPEPVVDCPGLGPAGGFALERFLPYRLSVLTNTASGAIARLYAERFGLSIPEWRVMAVLGRFEPLSANQVCERTAMDKVRVSRAATRLTSRRLIVRATDAGDRRRSKLRLSARGRRMHDDIVPLALAKEAALLSSLSADERDALDGLLAKLQARAATLASD